MDLSSTKDTQRHEAVASPYRYGSARSWRIRAAASARTSAWSAKDTQRHEAVASPYRMVLRDPGRLAPHLTLSE
ncbi:MAG: hypothetical protein KatS3mg058_1459 [Roseiflexus sp.]|nr:MAG: hypothetical protein KatS3mg058_1459 [Roseiflexus sp.]